MSENEGGKEPRPTESESQPASSEEKPPPPPPPPIKLPIDTIEKGQEPSGEAIELSERDRPTSKPSEKE